MPPETLIAYGEPVAVNEDPESIEAIREKTEGLRDILGPKVQLPVLESKPSVDEILNAILPPREWVDRGAHIIQYVSPKQASRYDVADLTKFLNIRLNNRQARMNKNGICPVKEDLLFEQCFSEIIRQVTISEPDRGLLLLRVRNDIMATILAYATLYQSAVTFSMRKML